MFESSQTTCSGILALAKMCGITHNKAVKLKVKLRRVNMFLEYINGTAKWKNLQPRRHSVVIVKTLPIQSLASETNGFSS